MYGYWEKIREPKIKAKCHPDNLKILLKKREVEGKGDEIDLDDLNEIMEQW